MATEQDARTGMRYMDHLRAVALAGVALIVEKTRTYGPSWKRRLGPGAWFTTVRPWDRLEVIVERHGGDVFAAISEDPTGADGSALACIRDMRNYLLLIEAEMVARGVVADPTPVPQSLGEEQRLSLAGEFDEVVARRYAGMRVSRVEENLDPSRGHEYQILLRCVPEPARPLRAPDEVVERATDAARDRASALESAGDVTGLEEERTGALGAGPVADGCYTILDLGHGEGLWSVGLGAVPEPYPGPTPQLHSALCSLQETATAFRAAGSLVASRRLQDSGDVQIIIRIPVARR